MAGTQAQWIRQPVLWLAGLVLVASLAGCIALVILAARSQQQASPVTDEPLLFRMPASREN